jgi:ABC-type glycerol-3-phosphate transport system substrate-binding protein
MALGIGCRTTPSHAPAAPPGPEPPASRRCTAPPGRPGLLDVPDVVARLRAAGLGADRTDEPIVSIFGGECAEVVRVNGLAVQVYRYATPAEAQQVQASAPVLFMSGKVGMGVTNIGRLSRYATIKDFAWGVGVMPRPPKGEPRRHHVWIDFWSMIKGTKNLEGSWQLLKFMVSPDAQRIYPIEYGPMSSLSSLAAEWSDYHKKSLSNLSAKEFQAIAEAPRYEVIDPENWTVNFSQINAEALQPELDKVYLGQVTAEQAIKNMAPRVRQIIDETKQV